MGTIVSHLQMAKRAGQSLLEYIFQKGCQKRGWVLADISDIGIADLGCRNNEHFTGFSNNCWSRTLLLLFLFFFFFASDMAPAVQEKSLLQPTTLTASWA